MATARCRFCGDRVKYFGDLCPACDSPDRYDEDGIVIDGTMALVRADNAALAARQDATEIGEGSTP